MATETPQHTAAKARPKRRGPYGLAAAEAAQEKAEKAIAERTARHSAPKPVKP